jgi:iron(III) transport system ATP-binding protein
MAATRGADSGGRLAVRSLTKRFGATEVLRGVSLDVEAGTVCALLGPSGSGKTTLLRAIAGLEVPESGEVRLGERVLSGPSVWVAPERRRIGMVFQDWALFPHLSVADNVAFGLARRDRGGRRVHDVLAMVGLEGFADRPPGTLSGGQQQRVALARALAPNPEVLLLDEPFSNLDVALRTRVRSEVHRLLAEAGVTAVFVTHDQEEAFVLGDQVAVVREGTIVQSASPVELYARPADAWVAGFVGDANLVPGDASGTGTADTSLGAIPLCGADTGGAERRGPVEVLVRPEHVALDDGDNATVELVEYYGHDCVLLVRLDSGLSLRARTLRTDLRRHDRLGVRYSGPPTVAFW